jgi:tetratricopeptide (TPR) repeat protein
MPASLVKLRILLILIIAMIYAEGSAIDVTGVDTARVNRLLRKGQGFHIDRPDSAIYYYQMIFDQPFLPTHAGSDSIPELERAYQSAVIKALNLTGNIYYYKDEYKRAETYYQRSLGLARDAGLESHEARALYDIGYIKYVTNEYAEAGRLFEESRRIYEGSGNSRAALDALHACGKNFRRLGDIARADSCYRTCLELASGLNDSLMIADVKTNYGVLLCEQSKLDEGILLFEEALDYYEKAGNVQAVSTALLNIGVVLKMVREYDKALEYMRRSTQLEEPRQQKSQLVVRYYNMADLYLEMGQNEKAYEYCRKIQAVADEIGSRPFITECNFLLGKYYYLVADYPAASRYFAMASDSVDKTDHRPLMANIHLWYAKTLLRMGQSAGALTKAKNAYRLSAGMKQLSHQKEASEVISEVYETSGNLTEALKWHKLYLALSDSLSHYEQQKEISRIEARYNYEKKEKENELLRNQASLQSQQIRNRTILSLASAAGIMLSLVIIVLLVKRSRDQRLLHRQQQLINLQQLAEMEDELDGKKRELASKMMFLNQKTELIGRIMQKLKEIQQSTDHIPEDLNEVLSELRMDTPQSNWREFEAQFTQVHPDFYKRLYDRHPSLTSYEQRICAFLRMNLNTKEISTITGRSAKSIEVARSRIRTKLRLSRNDNLSSFLAAV